MNQVELQNKIIEECQVWFELGCAEVGIDASNYILNVQFFSRGCVGGSAKVSGKVCTLKFNIILAMDNVSEYMNQIIPHEVAHLVTDARYGNTVRGYTKRGKAIYDHHGEQWQHVMRLMGKTPDRCHNMDVSKVKQSRTIKRWVYACPICNKEYGLTSQKHNKVTATRFYICNKCRNTDAPLCFTGEIREYTR